MMKMKKQMTLPMVCPQVLEQTRKGLTHTLVAEFIEEGAEDGAGRDDMEHRKLDQRRGEAQMESVEETVARLKKRYGRAQGAKYDPDSDQVPQRLLMPGNSDPNLFQVKVKVRLMSPAP
jgi:hypothetical protein